jgi:hypothetical protein
MVGATMIETFLERIDCEMIAGSEVPLLESSIVHSPGGEKLRIHLIQAASHGYRGPVVRHLPQKILFKVRSQLARKNCRRTQIEIEGHIRRLDHPFSG